MKNVHEPDCHEYHADIERILLAYASRNVECREREPDNEILVSSDVNHEIARAATSYNNLRQFVLQTGIPVTLCITRTSKDKLLTY